MSGRARDWLRQAEADLRHARHALDDGDHEWSCFAAQQAAEKAAKAAHDAAGAPADFYTRAEAERAIGDAEAVIAICRGIVSGP
jgi:HEPN domain-containing protein